MSDYVIYIYNILCTWPLLQSEMEYVRALSCLSTFMSTKWKDSEDVFSAPFFQPFIVQL